MTRPAGATTAVVFDYFGTLQVAVPDADLTAQRGRVGLVLGAAPNAFAAAFSAAYDARFRGQTGDLARTLTDIARSVGADPTPSQVEQAVRLRLALEWTNAARVRAGAPELLHQLRASGLRIGVVSDCSHELAAHWDQLPLAPLVDSVVLSFVEGVRKPDPHMYAAICARLPAAPEDCLYVGDGGSHELTGAAAAGMRTVRLRCADHLAHTTYDAEVFEGSGGAGSGGAGLGAAGSDGAGSGGTVTVTDLAAVANLVG